MITREQVFEYVKETYDVLPEKTFSKFPNYSTLKHLDSGKWFGLVMNVPEKILGLNGVDEVDIIDVKVESELIGSLIIKEGYFTAYHMNKDNWVSINLNSDVPFEEIKQMIDSSFKLTA